MPSATDPSSPAYGGGSVWGGVLNNIGPIIQGIATGAGAGSAASAQTAGAANANNIQTGTLGNVQNIWGPQQGLGYGADAMLAQTLGMSGPGGAPATGGTPGGATGANSWMNDPRYAAFANSPGFNFAATMGSNAINRQASANGSLYSTNTLQALGNFNTGIASTHYNDYVSQLMQAAGFGSTANTNLAGTTYNTGANRSAIALGAGNANASGVLGSASGYGAALGKVAGSIPWASIFGPSGSPTTTTDPNAGVDPNAPVPDPNWMINQYGNTALPGLGGGTYDASTAPVDPNASSSSDLFGNPFGGP